MIINSKHLKLEVDHGNTFNKVTEKHPIDWLPVYYCYLINTVKQRTSRSNKVGGRDEGKVNTGLLRLICSRN